QCGPRWESFVVCSLGSPARNKKVREPAILSLQEGGRGESGLSQTQGDKPVSSLTGVAVKLQHSASNPRPQRHTGSPRIVGPGIRWSRILLSYAISGPNPRKNLPIARFFPQVEPGPPSYSDPCVGNQKFSRKPIPFFITFDYALIRLV